MRSGVNGLVVKVETALQEDPNSGHVFVFRGRRGDLLKVLWWTGDGLCLLCKRLERERCVWPQASEGMVTIDPSPAFDAIGRHRLSGANEPPAVWFAYSPDRKEEHPQAHLAGFAGVLQADAHAGFNALYDSGRIV